VFGIGVDALLNEFYIPEDKVEKALAGIRALRVQAAALIKKDLQRLIGFLSFLAKALVAARTFLRRLINATCGVRNQDDPVHLDGGITEDLAWWEHVLINKESYSMSFQAPHKLFPFEHWLASDSSLFACGGTCGNHWFSLEFPEAMRQSTSDIAVKELAALVLTVLVWGIERSGSRLVMGCDNQAVIAILNSGSSKNPVLMSLMRFFVLECLRLNVSISPIYVRSEDNTGPDLLSRMKVAEYLRFDTSADQVPTPVVGTWNQIFNKCLIGHY
jgi:hypothetical protein